MIKTKNCDAKTLAVIAAQFIAKGDDEEEALRKANALYLKATAYAKKFASLSPSDKEIEASPEEALRALGEREVLDLAIGDSEANSPALKYFRETAKPKLDKIITHKGFLGIIKRFYDRRLDKSTPWTPPKKINQGVLDALHISLRVDRSRRRVARRKKSVN
jgi:hypothetical protein